MERRSWNLSFIAFTVSNEVWKLREKEYIWNFRTWKKYQGLTTAVTLSPIDLSKMVCFFGNYAIFTASSTITQWTSMLLLGHTHIWHCLVLCLSTIAPLPLPLLACAHIALIIQGSSMLTSS